MSGTGIRQTHLSGFRPGEWATLVMVLSLPREAVAADGGVVFGVERECFLVEFPDGVTDFWPVDDAAAGYEFEFAGVA